MLSHHFWTFIENDFETITNDIRSKPGMDDRFVALSLAFEIYKMGGRRKKHRELLKSPVNGNDELKTALDLLLHSDPVPEKVKRWRRREAQFKRRQKERDEKEAAIKQDWRDWLKANIHVLRDTSIALQGKVWRATYYLMDELRHKNAERNKWAVTNWEDLSSDFGQDVAEAFRDGCIDYWRKYTPKIRSEGIENQNSTPLAVTAGLSGLKMESLHDPKWTDILSEDEARLACRYAVNEMNGFPEWIQQLHTAFPDIVEESILKEIEWEFSEYDGEQSYHYFLDDVVWQMDWIKRRIASRAKSFLKNYEPKHDDTVQKGLGIVLYDPDLDKKAFVDIAKSKIHKSSSVYRNALWLASWMRLEANSALGALTSILDETTDTTQATDLSMKFIAALLGERRDRIANIHQDFIRPEILSCLIKLIHKHIRTEDDINRFGGGAYSPTLIDDAQEARGRLFRLLRDIPGKATYLALIDLSQHHSDEKMKRRYSLHAKRRAEEDAEASPWRPGDIAIFAEKAERAPQNHRELYDLAVSRLLDLKADLEHGDASLAGILKTIKEERQHRIMIGGWLREKSFGRYGVPQEDELADRKKPDLRIYGFGFDGPVPIELKVGDSWSGPKLFERLRNQLCGDYLRDARSNCGIFIIVHRGEQKHWRNPKTGERINFTALVQLLEKETSEIMAADQKIESIKIIDIDLTKR